MRSEPFNQNVSGVPESCRTNGETDELPKEILEDLGRLTQEHLNELCNQLAGLTHEMARGRFEKQITEFAEAANAGNDEEAREAMIIAFMISAKPTLRANGPNFQPATPP